MSRELKRNRADSAQSTSSNELIDKQLNELIAPDDNNQDDDHDDDDDKQENVSVMVRCRPLEEKLSYNNNNTAQSSNVVVNVDEINKCIELTNERQFYFDQVFGPQASNEHVYMKSARRLVEFAFRGFNCTIFLYGQTGTGKTYTHSSLTLSSFEHLFSLIQDSERESRFLIRASYYELYNEEIRDLLVGTTTTTTNRALELRESKERGVYVKNLSNFLVNNPKELIKLKQSGDKRRATAATRINQHSSRSHSIFSITIEQTTTTTTSARQQQQVVGRSKTTQNPITTTIRMGRLNLIDLAGSERQSKSGSSGERLKEASRINLSLTCLSLVIRALTDKSSTTHVPYRNSKLTRLLSNSLGGNSKTLLIACISSAKINLDETLNTLRFASRTKLIKNKALINEDPKDALLRKYRRQLNELRLRLNEQEQQQQQLGIKEENNHDDDNNFDDNHPQQMAHELELMKAKIMFGGENLLDKVELHEQLLEASRQELEERRREEFKLKEKLKSKKQTIEQVVQSKGSLESQLTYLNEKLRKAIDLYRRSKLELNDLAGEQEHLREQMLQTIRSTSKEIKYVDCIIDDFIPREYLDLINAHAHFDEESDEWQIKYIALSGNNIVQTKRLAAMSSNQGNFLNNDIQSLDQNSPPNSNVRPNLAIPITGDK